MPQVSVWRLFMPFECFTLFICCTIITVNYCFLLFFTWLALSMELYYFLLTWVGLIGLRLPKLFWEILPSLILRRLWSNAPSEWWRVVWCLQFVDMFYLPVFILGCWLLYSRRRKCNSIHYKQTGSGSKLSCTLFSFWRRERKTRRYYLYQQDRCLATHVNWQRLFL